MKQLLKHLLPAIVMISLVSCGGGGTVASGGSGGTGISTGSISGFGSIFVNGIEFDISGATLERNGTAGASENEFELGEVVFIQGSIDTDSGTGVATTVSYDEILRGPVTNDNPTSSSIEVLGQQVLVLPSTVLQLTGVLTDLDTSSIVEVSGYYNANRNLVATRIVEITSGIASIEAKLFVSSIDTNPSPDELVSNGLTVTLADLSHVSPDDLVQVEAASGALSGLTLTATSVTVIQPANLAQGTEIELAGIVTTYITPENFFVNVIEVDATGIDPALTALIALNVRVEVEGVINASGILVADSLEIKDEEEDVQLEVSGEISDKKTVPDRVTVQGNDYVIITGTPDASDLHGDTFDSLQTGHCVHIHAFDDSGDFIIEELERKDDPCNGDNGEIEGTVSYANGSTGELTVNGTTVITDITEVTTTFRGPNDNPISPESFFNSISIDSTEIHAYGSYNSGTGEFSATDIMIED